MMEVWKKLPDKILFPALGVAFLSTGVASAGVIESNIRGNSIEPEAVREYPDVSSQEELIRARKILNEIDAVILKNTSELERQQASNLLERQASIESARTKFISERMPSRLNLQICIGLLGTVLGVSVVCITLKKLVSKLK